jgi:predicted anti-sigma-YlaC factor YlaD
LAIVTCERWREAISARADGELFDIDERLVDAHLRRCPACHDFAATVSVTATPRPVSPPPPGDLTRRVSRAAIADDRASAPTMLRALLAVVAVEIIVVSVPALLGDEQATSTHAARHIGAFAVAYGVGLLVVVARPARARTMLPVAAVLAGALLITSVVDLAQGRIPLVAEAAHLPELVSVVLIWLIAVPPRRLLDRDRGAPRNGLELVDAHSDGQVPGPGEPQVGGRLVAADAEREDVGP